MKKTKMPFLGAVGFIMVMASPAHSDEFKPPPTNPPPPPPPSPGWRAMIAGICMRGFFTVDAAYQLFFIVGFGFAIVIARDYLLAINKNTRGAHIAIRGFFHILAGGMVIIIIISADFTRPYSINAKADKVWRIILIMAAALTYYLRRRFLETARYTALVSKKAKQAAADMSKALQVEIEAEQLAGGAKSNTFGLFSSEFLRHLFQKDIFSAIGWIPVVGTMNALEGVFRISRAQTLIAPCSTVPGYWFTVFLIDRIGRFASQVLE